VFGFARLHQAVVDGLIIWELVGSLEKATAALREGYHTQGLLPRDFQSRFRNQTLAFEPAEIFFHSLQVASVGIPR